MRGAYVARRSSRTPILVALVVAAVFAVGGTWMFLRDDDPVSAAPPVSEAPQEQAPAPSQKPVAVAAVPPAPAVPIPSPPVLLIENLACRTVETNDLWTRFSWQANLRTAGDAADVQVTVTLLDGSGFTVDETDYDARVTAAGIEVRDLRLVGKPQEETITTIMLVVAAGGQVLDEMRSPVERLAQPRQEQRFSPEPATAQTNPEPERRKAELWGAPRVLVSGSVVQTGIKIWNPGAAMATVNFELELYRDGEFVDSVSDTVGVPPGGRVPYNHTFETDGRRGSYSVSVRFW